MLNSQRTMNRDTNVMNAQLNQKIKLLKDYFLKRPDISMVFVFGSYVKDRVMAESDFDVAIYYKPQGKALEWEETRFYDDEDKIWGDVEKMIGLRTDIVVLNRAPSTLAFSVISEGIPVIIKDRSLHLRFLLIISSAAEYFMEFVSDFWKIKQRSMSLADVDKMRLIKTADFLEAELRDHPKFVGITQHLYESDVSMRRNVERWVENIINSSIDIAKIILASNQQRVPQTYRETLHELSLIKNFPPGVAEKLSQFTKLRNILAHEYLDIRFAQIQKFIEESEDSYKKLLGFVKSLLK